MVLMLGLTAGFALARERAHALGAPNLEAFQSERSAQITGWIERVERMEGRARLVIRVHTLGHADTPPYRVRIRAGLDGFEPGDAIQVRGLLAPAHPPRNPHPRRRGVCEIGCEISAAARAASSL